METDKRPFYIWLAVILANIGTYLTIMLMGVIDGGSSLTEAFLEPITTDFALILGLSLFVSVIPIWISGSNVTYRNRFGLGIPLLLLVPIPFLSWYAMTCTGKFCGLVSFVASITLGISAIVFGVIYAIGVYFRKWDVKVAQSLVWIEIILILGALSFLAVH